MSTLLAVIISVGNLNQQSEIIAMRASGIDFFSMMRPYLFLGIVLTYLLYIHQEEIVSRSHIKMNQISKDIYSHDVVALIDPGVFKRLDFTKNQERNIYVEKINTKNDERVLENIHIKTIMTNQQNDKWVSQYIVANKGKKVKKKLTTGETVNALRLFNGYAILKEKENAQIQIVNFNDGSFDLHLYMPENLSASASRKSIADFTKQELLEKYKQLIRDGQPHEAYITYLIEYHKRISLSFSAICFILLGFPLAITKQRSGKGFGLGVSVVFIFIYYIFFLSTKPIAEQLNFLPVGFIAWFGNLSILLIATYFYKQRLFLN